MTKHEAAQEIVMQGDCAGVPCSECPLNILDCCIPNGKKANALDWLAKNPEVTKQENAPYWYPEHKEAPMPKYKIQPISKDAPAWFQRGIKCKVWELPKEKYSAWVADFEDGYFITIDDGGFGCMRWPFAEPVEQWEPQKDEWVASWDRESTRFGIGVFELLGNKCFIVDGYARVHVARLQYSDGRVIDCACSVEELKGRTEWQ